MLNDLRLWALHSGTAALLAFTVGPGSWAYAVTFHSSNDVPDANVLSAAIWLGWLWIAIFAAALFFIGRRSLWLLLGAPFALGWPILWIFVAHACSITGNCLQ